MDFVSYLWEMRRVCARVCVDAFELIRDIFCAADIFRDAIAACPNTPETRAIRGYMCCTTLSTKSVRHRARTRNMHDNNKIIATNVDDATNNENTN